METLENATGVESGASGDTKLEGAGLPEQSGVQDQTSTPDSKVGSEGKDASSSQSGERTKRGNVDWAGNRVLEKNLSRKLERLLEEKLKPLLETIGQPKPSAKESVEVPEEKIDYNDLQGSIRKIVQRALEAQKKQLLEKEFPEKLKQFTSEEKFEGRIQEARKWLTSQKDIGNDPDKIEEVRAVMEKEMLDIVAEKKPLEAVQKAVELWRKGRVNPDAPNKEHLQTLAGGGAPRGGKKQYSPQDLVNLQKKLAGNPTEDELEKIISEIDAATAA